MFEDTVGTSETTEPVETASVETPDVAQSTTPQDDTGGINPAWQPLLSKLPESLHGMITPTLREWDNGVQNRFETVQSKYKPYDQFVNEGVDPDNIAAALQVAQVIRENPRFVFDKMVEQYGEEWGLGQDQGDYDDGNEPNEYDEDGEPQFSIENDPAFQQIQSQMDQIAQFNQAQADEAERNRLDSAINADFQSAADKYGELSARDVQMISSFALGNNCTVAQAADQLFEYAPRGAGNAQQHSLPNIVAPGGGQPAQIVNPATLDDKSTKSLVAQLLQSSLGQKEN